MERTSVPDQTAVPEKKVTPVCPRCGGSGRVSTGWSLSYGDPEYGDPDYDGTMPCPQCCPTERETQE